MIRSYPYTQWDLLNGEPYHYQYTPFEGAALLSAYRHDRVQAITRLKYEAGNAQQRDTASELLAPDKSLAFTGVFERPFKTVAELANASDWISRGGDICNDNLIAFVNGLVKKFEVCKRLRSRYGSGLRVVVHDSAPVDAYCYLAFLVARRLTRNDRLWRLNALLKLDDLIISSQVNNLSSAAARAAEQALRLEVNEVLTLAQDKGVVIG